jgi:hypothetical protein
LVRISNFNNQEIDLSDAAFVPNNFYDNLEFAIKKNDLVIAMSTTTGNKWDNL